MPGPKGATPAKSAMAPPATAEGPAGEDGGMPAAPTTAPAASGSKMPAPGGEGLLDDMDTYDPSQEEFVSATDCKY